MELWGDLTHNIKACDNQSKTTEVTQQAERAAQEHTDGLDGERTPFLLQIAGQPDTLTASRPATPCPPAPALA
jgi:hypothetical protein